jgi:multidrug resistance efflux pump
MANSFDRVTHSLKRDNGRLPMAGLLIAVLLLFAWLAWAFLARITRYEVSDAARLEVDRAAYPVQAATSGRLVSSLLVLGREVHAGDILAELDSNSERLGWQEERARLDALQPQRVALEAQLSSEEQGRNGERRLLVFSEEGARSRYEEAEAQATAAEQQAERAARLQAEGILARADAERAKAEAQSKRAAAENLKIAISRLQPELQLREQDRDVRQKQIQAEIAKLDADIATSGAAMRRLEYEIERRRIRAPIAGRLGECAPVRPGSQIAEGQQLGLILPNGNMQIIAEFDPAAALGKIRPGLHATMRLQGFPWAQYGTISAQVSKVAAEIRDGKVRVELRLEAPPRSPVPLQHGLPGSVEVAIEHVSPAALLLRSAGAVLGAH